MKISGRRADGALFLSMGAGVAIVLLGDRVSPPLDDSEAEALGPWTREAADDAFDVRQTVRRQLDRARVTSVVMLKAKPAVSEVADAAKDADAKAKPTDEDVLNLAPEAAKLKKKTPPVLDTPVLPPV